MRRILLLASLALCACNASTLPPDPPPPWEVESARAVWVVESEMTSPDAARELREATESLGGAYSQKFTGNSQWYYGVFNDREAADALPVVRRCIRGVA